MRRKKIYERFLFIRNKRLLKDEAKLKKARLEQTDERNVEIGIHAQRIAAMVLFVAMYPS